ncbi:MAG TPA: sucrase ferredoxin [Actinomycetota bacterium]|nr:sucrase ferredoxin [Actinomycetota bacterium]
MPGTASRYRLWLMVEQQGAWGHDALLQSDLPAEVGAALKRVSRDIGMRTLLIKRRERDRGGGRRCFVAYTGVHERRIGVIEVTDPRELLDIDLPGAASRRFDGLGQPHHGPLFLVCTHGKHDPCCARRGGPLYRSIETLPDAWECTHIGGDRFAANLVCFPHGLYFGRVGEGAGRAVAEAYAEGRIDLDHYRGRSAYSPPVQAAEDVLRRRHGLVGVDDLDLVAHVELGGDVHRVEFDHGARRHVVDVEVTSTPPDLLTCKAVVPHSVRAFAAVSGG